MFQDQWIDFYHKLETEKEFPLRNKQVLHGSALYIGMAKVLPIIDVLGYDGQNSSFSNIVRQWVRSSV